MNNVLRVVWSCCLAALFAVSGVQMAVARAAQGPAERLVICAGDGPRAILLDAQGEPVRGAHLCPDCALSLIAGLPGAVGLEACAPIWRPAAFAVRPSPAGRDRALRPRARAPPSRVPSP